MLKSYQREFIDFMLKCEVLCFGDFTTKSGRSTPYFINTGRYRTGSQLDRLASFYAQAIEDQLGRDFDVLFGPAYKGIPLAAATATKLHQRGHDVGFCFNRKEAKDHGEGGSLVGAELKRGVRVLIIEDVTTAGTSIRETVPILKAHADINVVGLVVSVDRKERTSDDASAGPAPSALAQLRDEFAFDHAFAIVDIDQVMEHLRDQQSGGDQVMDDKTQEAMLAYRKRYGASA
jgi:orotate phosphoribosyltransferase